MLAVRVEKHIIKKNNEHYSMLSEFCHLSKNLYNFANYHARQGYIKNGHVPNYYELEKLAKLELSQMKTTSPCLRHRQRSKHYVY